MEKKRRKKKGTLKICTFCCLLRKFLHVSMARLYLFFFSFFSSAHYVDRHSYWKKGKTEPRKNQIILLWAWASQALSTWCGGGAERNQRYDPVKNVYTCQKKMFDFYIFSTDMYIPTKWMKPNKYLPKNSGLMQKISMQVRKREKISMMFLFCRLMLQNSDKIVKFVEKFQPQICGGRCIPFPNIHIYTPLATPLNTSDVRIERVFGSEAF